MATDRFDAKLNYKLATHSKKLFFQLPAFGETRAQIDKGNNFLQSLLCHFHG